MADIRQATLADVEAAKTYADTAIAAAQTQIGTLVAQINNGQTALQAAISALDAKFSNASVVQLPLTDAQGKFYLPDGLLNGTPVYRRLESYTDPDMGTTTQLSSARYTRNGNTFTEIN